MGKDIVVDFLSSSGEEFLTPDQINARYAALFEQWTRVLSVSTTVGNVETLENTRDWTALPPRHAAQFKLDIAANFVQSIRRAVAVPRSSDASGWSRRDYARIIRENTNELSRVLPASVIGNIQKAAALMSEMGTDEQFAVGWEKLSLKLFNDNIVGELAEHHYNEWYLKNASWMLYFNNILQARGLTPATSTSTAMIKAIVGAFSSKSMARVARTAVWGAGAFAATAILTDSAILPDTHSYLPGAAADFSQQNAWMGKTLMLAGTMYAGNMISSPGSIPFEGALITANAVANGAGLWEKSPETAIGINSAIIAGPVLLESGRAMREMWRIMHDQVPARQTLQYVEIGQYADNSWLQNYRAFILPTKPGRAITDAQRKSVSDAKNKVVNGPKQIRDRNRRYAAIAVGVLAGSAGFLAAGGGTLITEGASQVGTVALSGASLAGEYLYNSTEGLVSLPTTFSPAADVSTSVVEHYWGQVKGVTIFQHMGKTKVNYTARDRVVYLAPTGIQEGTNVTTAAGAEVASFKVLVRADQIDAFGYYVQKGLKENGDNPAAVASQLVQFVTKQQITQSTDIVPVSSYDPANPTSVAIDFLSVGYFPTFVGEVSVERRDSAIKSMFSTTTGQAASELLEASYRQLPMLRYQWITLNTFSPMTSELEAWIHADMGQKAWMNEMASFRESLLKLLPDDFIPSPQMDITNFAHPFNANTRERDVMSNSYLIRMLGEAIFDHNERFARALADFFARLLLDTHENNINKQQEISEEDMETIDEIKAELEQLVMIRKKEKGGGFTKFIKDISKRGTENVSEKPPPPREKVVRMLSVMIASNKEFVTRVKPASANSYMKHISNGVNDKIDLVRELLSIPDDIKAVSKNAVYPWLTFSIDNDFIPKMNEYARLKQKFDPLMKKMRDLENLLNLPPSVVLYRRSVDDQSVTLDDKTKKLKFTQQFKQALIDKFLEKGLGYVSGTEIKDYVEQIEKDLINPINDLNTEMHKLQAEIVKITNDVQQQRQELSNEDIFNAHAYFERSIQARLQEEQEQEEEGEGEGEGENVKNPPKIGQVEGYRLFPRSNISVPVVSYDQESIVKIVNNPLVFYTPKSTGEPQKSSVVASFNPFEPFVRNQPRFRKNCRPLALGQCFLTILAQSNCN